MEETTNNDVPRTRNPRGQGDRLRGVLLDSAIELLSDVQDIDALSVRTVTAHAGVSATALYLHFMDKEDLLAAVKERCFEELRRYIQAGSQSVDEPREQLEAMGRAYVQFAVDRTGYYRVLFHTRHSEPDSKPNSDIRAALASDWPVSAERALGELVGAVARCLPPDVAPEPVATMLWAGLHGYVGLQRSVQHYPFPTPAEYVTSLVNAHLDARLATTNTTGASSA